MNSLLYDTLRAAHAAGEAILTCYHDPSAWQVTNKADQSPLTAADQAAEAVLQARLATLETPWGRLPVLSEESPPEALQPRHQWPACWLIDPLDGTREFLARNGEFAVNVALVVAGRAVLGVVWSPVLSSGYVGCLASEAGASEKEVGAWQVPSAAVIDQPAAWQPLRVAAWPPAPTAPLRLTVSRRHGLAALAQFEAALTQRYGLVEAVAKGSALKLCAVAAGEVHGYPRFGPTGEWDTAAAQAILEAAGGALVDAQGRPFRYNQRDTLLNGSFLAVCGGVADWLACWPAASLALKRD